ncbi:anthranilate synthase component I [Candidatus Aerophobetes bacterium]|uniref:Anthranilate synthase component 1 n=1 Tax=Aerophobetes bacterium TaxID=2030807 RepID=A0A662D6S9_UNCAE|nr:MAG: anthranilate synthase component I [Candidatus Aerophobetes bacterium]
MYYPEEEKFKKLSKKANFIPVYREILADIETPISAFKKLGDGKFSYLLESVEKGRILGRYSFLGINPFLILRGKKDRVQIIERGKVKNLITQDPLEILKKIMDKFVAVNLPELPRFSGGAVGYIGYDVVRFWEKIPEENPDDLNLPDFLFIFSDILLVFDHIDHKMKIISYATLDGKESIQTSYKEAKNKIDEILARLKKPSFPRCSSGDYVRKTRKSSFQSNFTPQAFMQRVEKAKEYIRKGDIFQVVLSQRFKRKVDVPSFNIYRALRSLNPSPYMYYLRCGDFEIIGSSPEILVRKEGEDVILRPIAGTRPRGKSEQEDKVLIKELLADPKEKAEHIMLVDLGRNDLGRVCEYGTVKTTELLSIEKYSHVMHLVSNIEGKLKKEMDQYDLLRACFPAGTVSGAPKIRAMEIIEELESCVRGPYAGALGYFSFSGNMDTCIIIRTIIVKGGFAYVQAGAGIVADSCPQSEYQETLNKARALFKAIEIAEEGMR